jgi:hypothetical protein
MAPASDFWSSSLFFLSFLFELHDVDEYVLGFMMLLKKVKNNLSFVKKNMLCTYQLLEFRQDGS